MSTVLAIDPGLAAGAAVLIEDGRLFSARAWRSPDKRRQTAPRNGGRAKRKGSSAAEDARRAKLVLESLELLVWRDAGHHVYSCSREWSTIALEAFAGGQSARAVRAHGIVFGLVVALARQRRCELVLVTPGQVKAALGCSSTASKADMIAAAVKACPGLGAHAEFRAWRRGHLADAYGVYHAALAAKGG